MTIKRLSSGDLPDWIACASGDQEALARLDLRPLFVGVERELIRTAISAEPQAVRTRLTQSLRPDDFARPDRAGGWIVPLGEGRHIVGGT